MDPVLFCFVFLLCTCLRHLEVHRGGGPHRLQFLEFFEFVVVLLFFSFLLLTVIVMLRVVRRQ